MKMNKKTLMLVGGLALLAAVVVAAILWQTSTARAQSTARAIGGDGGPTG